MPRLLALFPFLSTIANVVAATTVHQNTQLQPIAHVSPSSATPQQETDANSSFVLKTKSKTPILPTLPASATVAAGSFATVSDALSTVRFHSPWSKYLKPLQSSKGKASRHNTKVTVASSESSKYAAVSTHDSGTSYTLATPLTATSSVVPTYRNWVGPHKGECDAACWREAHIMDTCPSYYKRHEATHSCWTECPMEFPVACGVECVRQNDDCGREVFYKVSSLVNVGLNGIMDNWFGKFANMAKSVRTTVYCSCMLLGLIRAMLRYVRSIQSADPHTPSSKLLAALYQSNAVVVELPITIQMCLGKRVESSWWLADRLLATTQFIVAEVLANGDELVTKWEHFRTFLEKANFTAPSNEMTKGEIRYLTDALNTNSTCGHDLQGLVHRTWASIQAFREKNPGSTENELRVAVQETAIVKTDIAIVTSNCMELLLQQSDVVTAYRTRDTIRKTFRVIIDDLITKGKSNNGTSFQAQEDTYRALNEGMSMWVCTGFDMTGISSMISDYFQSICGPTQFIGEVDDGTHPDTLGLNMIQKAFKNSTLSWTRQGDGNVIIRFKNNDVKDVAVNLKSGGDKIDEVYIAKGSYVVWKSTVKQLGGKTLYMDRWRSGFLGLPSTKGGSLMLWVPHAAEGGHLELDVKVNAS